ncbi:hypothetical protein FACS1894187_25280 [Synergistales bacterium]|nr:hypothetical protein FACS1894187_25280 [Synergistales bacterium]
MVEYPEGGGSGEWYGYRIKAQCSMVFNEYKWRSQVECIPYNASGYIFSNSNGIEKHVVNGVRSDEMNVSVNADDTEPNIVKISHLYGGHRGSSDATSTTQMAITFNKPVLKITGGVTIGTDGNSKLPYISGISENVIILDALGKDFGGNVDTTFGVIFQPQ